VGTTEEMQTTEEVQTTAAEAAQTPEEASLEASRKVSLEVRLFPRHEIPQDLTYRGCRDLSYRWRKDLPEYLPQGYYPPQDLTHYLPEDYYPPQDLPEDRYRPEELTYQ
jgi:hypothetical protein